MSTVSKEKTVRLLLVVVMMMDYTNLLWCVYMMVWGFIVCLLLWTKSSSTIVKQQVSWSMQIGVRNLLFWGKKKEQFNLLFAIFKLSVTFVVQYYLGLLWQCSLCLHFKIIFLIYKIHTQRFLFYRYFSLWSTYIFLEDSKPDKSLNFYFKYIFYFLYVCSPNSYLTLWIVNPW